MDSYLLQPYEEPCSVMTTSFKPKDLSSSSTTMTTSLTAPPPSLDKYYFVVGTALALPSEDEPTKGRILVFSVTENKLRLEAETTVRGAVYCICDFNGKILAGVNSKVFFVTCLQLGRHFFFFFFFAALAKMIGATPEMDRSGRRNLGIIYGV